MKLIKSDEKGKTFETSTPNFKVLYRNKNSIAEDNTENPEELIFLITGDAEITLKKKTWTATAPTQINFPTNTYHKIKALTDISFIVFEN
jgi:hypothetical protein